MIEHRFDATPEFGQPVALDEGLHGWLRLRLPFALDHVNLWLCDDGDGWTVIDTGYGDAATRAVWAGRARTACWPAGRSAGCW